MPEEIFATPRGRITKTELLRATEFLAHYSNLIAKNPTIENIKHNKEAWELIEKIKGMF